MSKTFNVSETVVWNSRVGKVECEYRGYVWGMEKEACVIVPASKDNSVPYQTMVPYRDIEKK